MQTVPYTAQQERGSTDPTRTKTVRSEYAARLRGRFADINTVIRRGVRDRDIFGLGDDSRSRGVAQAADDLDDLPVVSGRRQDQQIETFDAWLRRQQQNHVLEVIDRRGNRWVRHGYGRGIKHASARLREAGIDVPDEDLRRVFALPVHEETLQTLYTSDYSDLEGITAEVSKQANQTLTQGFAEGVGPDEVARRLTDRVDTIGKTRATTLARTSIIDAHARATLNRYERFGVGEVDLVAEFLHAGDDRVCELCHAAAADNPYTIEEAKGLIPRHPRCRCSWAAKPRK